jgi:hypothetical protein
MEEAIRARLLATAGVTALVSQRVYCGSRSQGGTLPDIIINRVSGAPVYTDDGASGLASARLDIDCWGMTYASAKGVARAVIAALSIFTANSSPTETIGGTVFQNILLDAERDFREGGGNVPEYLFRTNLDFIIWFQN